jgi:glucose/arabinose dehydrogenase
MRPSAYHTTLTLAIMLAFAGCSGGKTQTSATHTQAPPTSSTTTSQQATPAALEQAARRAVLEDHHVLVRALVTNFVPETPPGTAGPALASLRKSVAERQQQKVRVRILSDSFRVLTVALDPSFTSATATILDTQRVLPTHPNGRPRGGPSAAHERARLELRRIGDTERFVVWKVTLLK